MTIEKGRQWGRTDPLPEDGVMVRGDAEAREVVEAAFLAGSTLPTLGLLGGDLCRTVGGGGDEKRLLSTAAVTLPVDLGVARLDGREHCFVAHLIARQSLWRGQFLVVMNASWYGDWYLGPKAHPNDGLLDITEGSLPWRDRIQARQRLRSASHLPHPRLRTARVSEFDHEFDRSTPVYLDGERVGPVRHLAVRVQSDALEVVI